MRGALALLPLVLLAASGPVAAQSYGYIGSPPDWTNMEVPLTKNDRLTRDYVSAWLVYDAGAEKGGILWVPNATVGGYTAERTHALVDLEWRSLAPVPETLYLNATREIAVTLYRSAPTCTNEPIQYTVDLFLDGRRIAGWIPGMKVLWAGDPRAPSGSPVRPEDPVGYCGRHFRLRAETDLIPAGSQLALHVQQTIDPNAPTAQPSRWGTFGRPQSVIRFPTLPLEDAIYRHRAFDARDVADVYAGPAGGDAGTDSAAAGGLLALAWPLVRGRRGPMLALGLLLVSGLAGCLGGDRAAEDSVPPVPPAPTGGTIDARVVPVERIDGTAGWLAGRVFDERHLPVAGAFVLLEGTENASYTDRYAGFLFRDVVPATYTLRAEAAGFRPFVGLVDVAPGGITKVGVQLEPTEGRSEDLRDHTHDLWLGRSTVDFPPVNVRMRNYHREEPSLYASVNERVPERRSCQWRNQDSTVWAQLCADEFFFKSTTGGAPHPMVLRGASLLELTLTWTGGGDVVDRVGLLLDHRADEPDQVLLRTDKNRVMLAPRASGETFALPVTWEMADHGHQSFSLWRFGVYIAPQAGRTSDVPPDGFTVKARIHKGPLPLDPPHPDPWGANETRLLRDHRKTDSTCSAPTADGAFLYVGSTCEFPAHELRLVPAGTLWLETYLNHTYSVIGAPALTPTRVRTDVELRYWTAGDPHWFSEGRVPTAQGGPKAGPANAASGYFLERMVVCLNRPEHAGDPDPAYETKTSWRYRVDDGHTEPYEPSTVRWTYRLGLVAHRTTPAASVCPA